jgi:hypothetical protein
MCLRVVVLAFRLFASILVRMDQHRVIVLVQVIRRAVLELADRAIRVVMRHVPVVVAVDLALVLVHVLDVADDLLPRRGVDSHRSLLIAGAIDCT